MKRDIRSRSELLRIRGRSVAWVPPLLMLVGITLTDFNTAGAFRMITWVVLVPGIAAAICGVWGTAVFAVLALLNYLLADTSYPDQYQSGLPDFLLVGIGGVLAVLACAVRVRGERLMLHMRDVADTTRRTVLRPLPVDWGGLEHAAVYLASDVEARVGGDFYDIQPGPHGTRVLVGDVQGKGLAAVEAAAALLGTFREAAYHEADLTTVADRLEVRMVRHRRHIKALAAAVEPPPAPRRPARTLAALPDRSGGSATRALRRLAIARTGRRGARPPGGRRGFDGSGPRGDGDGNRFATAVLLGFPDDDTGAVDAVVFGHEPPLVVGPHGVRHLPPGEALPLGLGELATGGPPPVLRVPLAPGETLLLTTDGVTEARDAGGLFYPLAAEVTDAVAADPRIAEPHRLVAFVRDRTLRHCGGRLADDTTAFAVRRPVGSPSGKGRLQS
ncbi:PP2C family protein-serine/threonine phosphatase [Streptomyces sp. WM6386]|uniref:PP2C family protein-serine/threonine phosphatase n=1 Tax=Streptomyces sp. WM6386 TaxID=1415558 RepID=UPI000619E040|nr:PP2C family protein-serine/threonine phosphatase [Streptomyces sp. WM6386]KKD05118.1 integral membrane protein [Streptomyces sp. WM6386]